MGRVGRAIVGWLLALAWPAAATAQAAADAQPFADCRNRVAQTPDDYEAVYCFFDAARSHGAWEAGLREVDALTRPPRSNAWATLVAGHLHRYRQPVPDTAAAEARYRSAARAFGVRRDAEGEILALTNLRDMLMPLGRAAEAAAFVARVVEIGRTVTDPDLQARVWMLEATHTRDTGGDLGHAYRLLRQTERAVFPNGPYRLRRTCLASLGSVAFQLGRFDEALELFARLDAEARAAEDIATQASARFQAVNTRLLSEELLPTAGGRSRLIAEARAALALAEAARSDRVALVAHRVLADLLAHDPSAAAATQHGERCLAIAAATGQRQDEAACAWRLALLTQGTAPAQAHAFQQQARRATELANSPVADASSVGSFLRWSWLTQPGAAAAADTVDALAALETLRALQETAISSAESFATWTGDYYWLAGRLLQAGGDAQVARAFSVVERLRARTLLDARQRLGVRPDAVGPAATERQTILRDIAALQREAIYGAILADSAARSRLVDLEGRLAEIDRHRRGGRGRPTPAMPFADLSAVEAALQPHEALLSYQLGLWEAYNGDFGGGAWLTVITARSRRAYRLPDRGHFAARVPVFAGLLRGDTSAEAVPASRLWHDLFATALADLPSTTTRLVVVPDGPLHALPFDALRESPGSAPLAARFEIETTPSATLWLSTRRASTAPARALVLADPALPVTMTTAASPTRQAWLDRGVTLGPLPHTRRERQAAERTIDGVDVLEGATASERALKTRDLAGYSVVHVAAHAIADETAPERSAVVLAAGDEAEDGLLQPREIAELRLDGKVVILSACQTAGGVVLGGEGMMSLARAFFEAGARAVVGTRWPVEDDGTARFFEWVYEGLGRGQTVSAALAQAKRNAIESGLPSSVWAGVVLLGDGAIAPLSPRRSGVAFVPLSGIVVGVVMVTGTMLIWWRRAAAAGR
jgi:hypothetical protein